MSNAIKRITEYLLCGGLNNPELADHAAVRDLLIDSREEITRLREAIQKHKKAFDEEDITVEDQMLWDVLKESGDG